jgi:hypothetical protein
VPQPSTPCASGKQNHKRNGTYEKKSASKSLAAMDYDLPVNVKKKKSKSFWDSEM